MVPHSHATLSKQDKLRLAYVEASLNHRQTGYVLNSKYFGDDDATIHTEDRDDDGF